MSSGVYRLRINSHSYFGRSVNMERRKSRHLYELRKGIHANQILQRSFNKNSDFLFEILMLVNNQDLQIELEQALIDKVPNSNLSPSSKCGNLPGEKHLLFGKPLSIETKEKISTKVRGINHPFFGKTHKDSTKKKISLKNSGTNNGQYKQEIIKFHHDGYGILECTRLELRNKFGLTKSGLSNMINGRSKTCKGWYIEDGK